MGHKLRALVCIHFWHTGETGVDKSVCIAMLALDEILEIDVVYLGSQQCG